MLSVNKMLVVICGFLHPQKKYPIYGPDLYILYEDDSNQYNECAIVQSREGNEILFYSLPKFKDRFLKEKEGDGFVTSTG